MAAKRFPYRVLGEPDAVISGNPYWLLPTVLGLAEDGTWEYLPGRLKEYKAACAYHDPGGCCPDSGGRARADQAPRAQAVCRAQADADALAGGADVPARPGLGGGWRSVRGGTPERRLLHDRTAEALIPGGVLLRSTPAADDGRLDPYTTV
ncbi:hypothetical protein ACQEVY_18775 [Streptomyces sp. CA-288835]|uniref:hypothetical protein n=1 Tax=Streptomyces sp. CA-288835 TaxID=3240069 RepID=UPI003D8DD7A0